MRPKIPIALQVRVFYRDGWLCRWCHRPTVFSPTFRLPQRAWQRALKAYLAGLEHKP